MKRSIMIIAAILIPIVAIAQVWDEQIVADDFDGAFTVHAADVDRDGDMDVLGAAPIGDEISWWENADGNGIQWIEHEVDALADAVHGVHAVDLDGDGDIDILGAQQGQSTINWYENIDGNGISWIEHFVDNSLSWPSWIQGLDMDTDGDIDILCCSFIGDGVAWWENLDGIGLEWVEHTIDNDIYGLRRVHAADLDGDGDQDVVGASYEDDIVTWWENITGNGYLWVEHVLNDNLECANSVLTTDVDSDGDLDIIATIVCSDRILWWENLDGDASEWAEHTLTDEYDAPQGIHATDIDGDGDIDILCTSLFGSLVTWWENTDGLGTAWSDHTIDIFFEGATNTYAADINGDGNIDVLCAGLDGNKISWWKLTDSELIVEFPNFGEEWEVYTTKQIQWATFSEDRVTIELLRDGSVLSIITSNLENTGLYEWYVPGYLHPGDNYQVRVTMTPSGLQDVSDSTFTIFNDNALTVMHPNGGDSWRIGTSHTVRWLVSSAWENVRIELYKGPVLERLMSENTRNDGWFEWLIPEDVVPDDNYRVRIVLLSDEEQDVSDNSFSIIAFPSLAITPHHPPIVIPDDGEGFWYWLEITNLSSANHTADYWTEVILPSGNTYGPLTITSLTLDAWETFSPADPIPVWVPPYAPPGIYEFVMHVGIHPDVIIATDSFSFEKLAGANVTALPESAWSVNDWHDEAWELANAPSTNTPASGNGNYDEAGSLPTDYAVSSAHPNPFNASTSISISLPESTDLTVVLFNVAGQRVAELANGQFNAGIHLLTIDASNLASGLYFVRATVPGQLDQMQKMMLVR
jgi:FG-GAP-like repeat/Secretion system C-terminal sorting domain/Kre9/KNH-like N-terminal Ig-like domain